jgi:hypothetical protein
VVERLDEPDEAGRLLRLTVELQADFALNQPLSTFALAALALLDRESPTYALDVLSVMESTLEAPRAVLGAQLNKAKGEAVSQMKADGIEYEERMELLEDVTYPKPLEELLTAAFEIYRGTQPWVEDHLLTPKSVARDMFERAMTFVEYVSFYSLARSEGLVLRYLSDAYKAMDRTVPDEVKTEEAIDLTEWLGEVVRQTDSSLLDEWERLQNPEEAVEVRPTVVGDAHTGVTSNPRAFRVLVRNALFRRVELAAIKRYDLLGELDKDAGFDAQAWSEALAPYWEEYDEIGTQMSARAAAFLMIDERPGQWLVRQIFEDPAGDRDWGISAEVDLAASDEAGGAVLRVTRVDQL